MKTYWRIPGAQHRKALRPRQIVADHGRPRPAPNHQECLFHWPCKMPASAQHRFIKQRERGGADVCHLLGLAAASKVQNIDWNFAKTYLKQRRETCTDMHSSTLVNARRNDRVHILNYRLKEAIKCPVGLTKNMQNVKTGLTTEMNKKVETKLCTCTYSKSYLDEILLYCFLLHAGISARSSADKKFRYMSVRCLSLKNI